MRTTTAPGICAWLAHLRIRGSTRSAIFYHSHPRLWHLFSSIDHTLVLTHFSPPQQTDSLIFSRPCLLRHRSQFHSHFPPSVLLPCSRTCLTLSSFFFSLFFFFDALHCTSACCKLYSILSIFRYYSWGTLCVIHDDYNRTFFWSGPRCVCVACSPSFSWPSNPNCPPSLRTKAVFISGRARLTSDRTIHTGKSLD